MKRWIMKIVLGIAVIAVLSAGVLPLVELMAKRRVVSDLGHFIDRGSLKVGGVSVSLKRRQARFRDVSVDDPSGTRVIFIPKIDVNVRSIHRGHVDASVRIFDPLIRLNLDYPDRLADLLNLEAFREKSRVEVDRVEVEGGHILLAAPGVMASPETLALSTRLRIHGDTDWSVAIRASGPQTIVQAHLVMAAQQDVRHIMDGTQVDIWTTNLALVPTPSGETPGFRLRLAPADSLVDISDGLQRLQINADFIWGPVRGRFRRIRPASDSPGEFHVDEMTFILGPEALTGHDNDLDVTGDSLRMVSRRWIRLKTGLTMENVHLLAGRRSSGIRAGIGGGTVAADADWGDIDRVTLVADTISIPLLLHEIGESIPVSGFANVRATATRTDTSSGQIAWNMQISSPDLRVGPAFGRISMRTNLSLSGAGTSVMDMSGTVEPAPGVPVRIRGRVGPRGFSGQATLKDRPLRDIRLLGESFGREIPLVGELGRAGLDVDFSVDRNLQLFLHGRIQITDARVMSKGFPFLVEGLDVDFPFEYTPDTGRLVLSDAVSGRVSAGAVVIGPYRFENFTVTTASRGDKIFAEFSPISAFGGAIRARALFHFSDPVTQQHAELALDGVSLRRILAPFPDARVALSGLLYGEADIRTRNGDILTARGPLRLKVVDGPGEPMRVSRRFLEQIGGAAVRKLDLPDQVPYKDGTLKVRVADGRIWFDEAQLEARTMLRKVRIGKVVGSYMIKDLIDVLSNVSAENVKVELGGRKRK